MRRVPPAVPRLELPLPSPAAVCLVPQHRSVEVYVGRARRTLVVDHYLLLNPSDYIRPFLCRRRCAMLTLVKPRVERVWLMTVVLPWRLRRRFRNRLWSLSCW